MVRPGSHARYAIWVWLTSGSNATVKVRLTAKPHSLSPVFTVCQPAGHATCKLAKLSAGQHVELLARIAVPKKETNGTHITLTATATSPEAAKPRSASATVRARARPTPSPTSTPTPSPTGTALGDGGSLPPPAALPTASIPGLPNPTGNAASAFPQVQPSPHASPTTLPPTRMIRANDVSAGLPLNVRLIGGQLVGLAILAAAVTIAVARMSLRKQRHDGKTRPDAPGEDPS